MGAMAFAAWTAYTVVLTVLDRRPSVVSRATDIRRRSSFTIGRSVCPHMNTTTVRAEESSWRRVKCLYK